MVSRQVSACAGFVLTGGRSSRIGVDKAFLPFRGQLLLDRAIHVLAAAASPVTIVGDPGKFSTYGVTVADEFSGCGPLAGIHAGLKHSSSELNLFLAVDMPFVSEELLRLIRTTAEQSDATVVVPRTIHGLQPLCAAYRRSFAHVAEESLKSRKYKIDAAFAGLSVQVIEESELLAHGFSERLFFNVNTPEDLEQAEQSGRLA